MAVGVVLAGMAPWPGQAFDLPWSGGSGPADNAAAPRPRPVVSEILSDRAVQVRAVPGAVVARKEVALAFLTLGRLTDRAVDLGDRVEAGAVLAQLDPEDLDDQVRAAEAALAAAQAQYDTTEATATRTRYLAGRDVTSTAQLEAVENNLAAAGAALLQAQSQLIRARDQQGFAEIIAPFDGVISAVWAEPGEVVQAGAPIITLSDRNSREAIIDLTEGELARMAPGAVWHIWQQADPDSRFAAPVDRIAPLADIRTRTRRVHLTLPAEAPFRLGALIRATREDPGQHALTLPASAILQSPQPQAPPEGAQGVGPGDWHGDDWQGGLPAGPALRAGPASVWVVIRDPAAPGIGHVALRPVTIAPRADGRVGLTGLDPGVEVVTRGIHSLTEGQPVGPGVAP